MIGVVFAGEVRLLRARLLRVGLGWGLGWRALASRAALYGLLKNSELALFFHSAYRRWWTVWG